MLACESLAGWHDDRIEAAMEIKTLAALQQPDDASLMFGPWGLRQMSAEDSAKFQQEDATPRSHSVGGQA
jgi:predicted acyl esterase